MKKRVYTVAVILGVAILFAQAKEKDPEIRLRNLDLKGLINSTDYVNLGLTFDVKGGMIFDEASFDYYLLLIPRDKNAKPQFFHCRTVHRYLEEGSGHESGVYFVEGKKKMADWISSSGNKYGVTVTYKGKEVAMESSDNGRWWEDESLGAPVVNVLQRYASVPIVRDWESSK